MLVLSFRFLAGRYHATPWGRHVNEADVAWPPEPWRLLRALIAVWHRKADHARFSDDLLGRLIDRLAEAPPLFRLPPAVHSHSRHYMPWFKKGPEDRTLIFDGFLHLAKDDPLDVYWPDADVPADEQALLQHLVERLGYLGRAESWVEVTCRFDGAVAANCWPCGEDDAPGGGDVTLLAALPAAEWQAVCGQLRDAVAGVKPAVRKLRHAVLAPRLLDALRCDTSDWQAAGFSRPPSAQPLLYRRAAAEPTDRVSTSATTGSVTTARFVLAGRPLPLLTDALRIGEIMHRALIGVAGARCGKDQVPWQLSGHGDIGNHDHVFILPEDADGDRHIDHITIHANGGFDASCQGVLTDFVALWGGKLGEWRMALESLGSRQMVAGTRSNLPVSSARCWVSRTPYLHPWYRKPGFGPEEQLRRELQQRGWPAPTDIEPLADAVLRPVHFHRFRSRGKQRQPDRQGSLWRLVFAQPVSGPMALGYACHYGLGMFMPDEPDDTKRQLDFAHSADKASRCRDRGCPCPTGL